jgi:hypothetical protein
VTRKYDAAFKQASSLMSLDDILRLLQVELGNREAREAKAAALGKTTRATNDEMWLRDLAIWKICETREPLTVRSAYYMAIGHKIIVKDDKHYPKIQGPVAAMRLAGVLPWSWIVDESRWRRRPQTFDSLEEAIQDASLRHRRDVWRSHDEYIEIWIEKDAMLGVIYPITYKYDIDLLSARGFSSLTFLHDCAMEIRERAEEGKKVTVYYLADHGRCHINSLSGQICYIDGIRYPLSH